MKDTVQELLENEANGYAIKEWAVESKEDDIFKVITKSYIAGATTSSTVKELEREVEMGKGLFKDKLAACLNELYEKCKHGDEDHQKWLKEKFDNYLNIWK